MYKFDLLTPHQQTYSYVWYIWKQVFFLLFHFSVLIFTLLCHEEKEPKQRKKSQVLQKNTKKKPVKEIKRIAFGGMAKGGKSEAMKRRKQ